MPATTAQTAETRRIKIFLHQADYVTRSIVETGEPRWFCEKEESGKKRRYIYGVASGLSVDAHGERMGKEAVEDFIRQAEEKDIPLYVNHQKDYTDDVGILTKSELLENGDWLVEFRLYDSDDGVGPIKTERADTLWKQINGLPPYYKKRSLGFSIEGFVAQDNVRMEDNVPVILKVDLDPGVTIVTKPAYGTSVANAIQKAFDTKNVRKTQLDDIMSGKRAETDFFEKKYEIEEAFDAVLNKILSSTASVEQKQEELADLYNSLRDKSIELYRELGFSLAEDEIGNETDENTTDQKPMEQKSESPTVSKFADGVSRAVDGLRRLKAVYETEGKKMPKAKKGSEEAATILSDVIAALQQLQQADAGEGMTPEGEDMDAAAKERPPEENQDEENAAAKEAEGAQDTEENMREEVIPDETPEVKQAAKALALFLSQAQKSTTVKPKAPVASDQVIKDVASALKILTDRQAATETALSGIMKGMGIGDMIAGIENKSGQPQQPVQKGISAPNDPNVMDVLAKALAGHLSANGGTNGSETHTIKQLGRDGMASLFRHQ